MHTPRRPLGALSELALRILLVGLGPVVFIVLDSGEGRALQLAAFWLTGVGAWSIFRLREPDVAPYAFMTAQTAVVMLASDPLLRGYGHPGVPLWVAVVFMYGALVGGGVVAHALGREAPSRRRPQ